MELITKLANKNYLLDLTNRRITMLDGRFYFTESGLPIPSVTTILSAYPKGAAFYEWLKKNGEDSDNIRDEAGRKGSKVHDLTERYDKGEEVSLMSESGDFEVSMAEWGMLEKWVEFRARFNPEILEIEQNIMSEDLGIAGTRDRSLILPKFGRLLVDIKTGTYVGKEAWLQLSAYRAIDRANGLPEYDGVAICHLAAKTKTDGRAGSVQGKGWQLLIETDGKVIDEYYDIFCHTQKLWLSENAGLIPRQVTYSLSHKQLA
jgi:hypothetical protein